MNEINVATWEELLEGVENIGKERELFEGVVGIGIRFLAGVIGSGSRFCRGGRAFFRRFGEDRGGADNGDNQQNCEKTKIT